MTNNNAFSLEGKIFLVTGASSGIGFEICRVIDSLGGRLIAVARREENLIDLLSKCKGKEHKYVAADLVKESDLDRIIEAIDKVDGIVHCVPDEHDIQEEKNNQKRLCGTHIFIGCYDRHTRWNVLLRNQG